MISIFLQMEDDLNFSKMVNEINIVPNVRRPLYFSRWKVTSIIWKMEDDLNYLVNGRQPQLFGKWKTTFSKSMMTQLFWQMENNFNV